MSLDRCFVELELGGKIDAPRSKEARELYEELKRFYGRTMDAETAAAMASKETVTRLEAAAAHKKRNLLRQAAAQKGAIAKIRAYGGGGDGPMDPRAAAALFDRDPRAGHNDNVETRRKAIKSRAHGMMDELLYQHRTTVSGKVRNRAQLGDIVRELFKPGSSGSAAARELADAWSKAAEYLRSRYNAAGGQIGKLEDWGLPQSHNSRAVRAAGFTAWRDELLGGPGRPGLLDRGKMIDRRTGQPFTDEALETALRDVFETIRTDGWAAIKPGAAGGKMLANQRAEHRFLHFRDADAWLAYNAKFGDNDPFSAMMGHVEGMSRDIALMEILGPNPAATVRWLKDTLQKAAAEVGDDKGKAASAAKAGAHQVEQLYGEITGALRRPVSDRIALGFSAFRSVQTAAKLGSATLSAITDVAFGAVTRGFNGLPVRKMLTNYVKQLNPASAEDRKFAVRAGLIAEEWAHLTASQQRFLGEELTGEWARRLAGGVLKASGLNAWTQAGRWAFGMEFLGHLTDQLPKRFDQLDGRLAGQLKANGIGADAWEIIRKSPLEQHKGAEWLLPKNIADQAIGDRLMGMILNEADFAVPVPDLRTRAMLNGLAPRGTVPGEIVRSALQFKTFGISVMLTHGRRMIENGPGVGAMYAASLFVSMTVMGALALQLKEIARGKDPREATGENWTEFWGAAMLQGGGFAIFGDFLGQAENRFGGGFASTLAGPSVQTAQNVADLTLGNTFAAVRGDETQVGRDLIKVLKQETPGGSLWYARLAFERLVLDQLQAEIDPDYRASFRRMRQMADERGQEFFWEPGELAPERAPALGGNE